MAEYMALKEEDIEAEQELIKEYQLTLQPRSAQLVSSCDESPAVFFT